MPGSVANAGPATVLPRSLSRAFVHSREYPVQINEYRNGETQRGRVADTSRKRWRLGKRLTPAALQTLREFYDARKAAIAYVMEMREALGKIELVCEERDDEVSVAAYREILAITTPAIAKNPNPSGQPTTEASGVEPLEASGPVGLGPNPGSAVTEHIPPND